jgi:hypothetical protein
MTQIDDTQNDAELDAQIDGIFAEILVYASIGKITEPLSRAKASLLALIASCEQAAELRGRESETEYWRQSGFLPLFDADKRLMELELQATKPENILGMEMKTDEKLKDNQVRFEHPDGRVEGFELPTKPEKETEE